MNYPNTILASSPWGYWRLDESSGTSAADSSGNGRTGTYTGSYTLATTGAIYNDTSLKLTGGCVAPSSTFNSGVQTWEAWINMPSLPTTSKTGVFVVGCMAGLNAANGFTTLSGSGTWNVPTGISSVSVLVVAGGGSGGASYWGAGGGGGGGVIQSTLSVTPGGTVSYSIGAGGAAVSNNGGQVGNNGSNSTFGSLTAIGGGSGGCGNVSSGNGSSGGSGGGCGGWNGSIGTGGSATAGQGNAGGSFTGSASNTNYGGGGGGAGAAGGNETNSGAGNGGIGILSSISGVATYYAGGGGGTGNGGSNPGNGGLGGGGLGASNDGVNGTSATAATGGGGGGGGYGATSGAGGSGIIIVSYTQVDKVVYATSTGNIGAFFSSASGSTLSLISPNALSLNTWHHVVSVQNGTNGYLYIDGMLVASSPIGSGFTGYATANAFIGAINSSYDYPNNMCVDEVALYSTALSPSTIVSHYNAGLYGKYSTYPSSGYTAFTASSYTNITHTAYNETIVASAYNS